MNRYISGLLLVSLLTPLSLQASHRTVIDRDDLDDDIVEEIAIPVLFGVELDEVVPDFGDPRGGGTRSHEGQDFLVPRGTPIVSPTEAIVIRAGTGDSAGKYVYTANPGGETFRYMHLDEFADLDPGDELDVGDYIGTVGDTGNALEGSYHLHFEIRDEDNDPIDPYTRLGDEFTLKEKVIFLKDVFRDRRDDEEYAEFLVETFPDEMVEADERGYDLPNDVEDALEDSPIYEERAALLALQDLIKTIPLALNIQLQEGDQGPAVQLLQVYLIYGSEGPFRDQLAAAGPTGYYGSITTAAMLEHQGLLDITVTGAFDGDARQQIVRELAK
jgi:hypothetical protein